MQHALICPQCNAPLLPSRFARAATCVYCGTTVQFDIAGVPAATFKEAFRIWNSPETYPFPNCISIGDSHWALEGFLARGEVSDVYAARRARWPTERVVLKILRTNEDSDLFENAWEIIEFLQHIQSAAADTFTKLLPQPVLRGEIRAGDFAGSRAMAFRWEAGVRSTFADVAREYPQGIEPRASIWVWRRILEVLHFLHEAGIVHGAILPIHILLQEHEHGIRLAGFGCAGNAGKPLRAIDTRYEPFYPQSRKTSPELTPQMDLVMSARCILSMLGGNPGSGVLPAAIPKALETTIRRIAHADQSGAAIESAWSIREELGKIAQDAFGPPAFCPIIMPEELVNNPS